MEKNIVIIDDDVAVRKMLANIITKNRLGKVVCVLDSGEYAWEEIEFYHPHIVLIDLLLPGQDGISIMRQAQNKGFMGKMIMISQATNQELIGNAYENGAVFYIKKPINAVEVATVIRNVANMIELESSMNLVKSALLGTGATANVNQLEQKDIPVEEQIYRLFTDIGIIGVTGSEEAKEVLLKIMRHKRFHPDKPYKIQDIYDEVLRDNGKVGDMTVARRTLEQRIRRVIQKALTTIAELGCENYYNDTFNEYTTLIFDFSQVRQEMRHVQDPTAEPGKINSKKFFEGLLSKLS